MSPHIFLLLKIQYFLIFKDWNVEIYDTSFIKIANLSTTADGIKAGRQDLQLIAKLAVQKTNFGMKQINFS